VVFWKTRLREVDVNIPSATHLMSHLEDQLTVRRSKAVEKLKDEVKGIPGNAVVYYYFDHSARSSTYSAMATLLRQLCYHNDSLPPLLAAKWAEWNQNALNPTSGRQTEGRMKLLDIISDFFTCSQNFTGFILVWMGLMSARISPH